MTPLTHHDVVRHAAPLVRAGLRIDPDARARAARRVDFHPVVSADDESLHALHALSVLPDGGVELVRAVAHAPTGLVSTLIARAATADSLIETFAAIAPSRQIACEESHVTAFSWTLEPADAAHARLELQQVVGQVGALTLVVDVSTGAGMPADAWLATRGDWTDHLRETLASGAMVPQRQPAARRLCERLRTATPTADGSALLAALPDDVLAVLGPQWRPLVWQGTRWKGVLRLLGREPERSAKAERLARAALAHLGEVTAAAPSRYHARHARARWHVFVRRLRPAMALLAILGVMPLAWLFVDRGGVEMHPLALGLTPLLMVGVVLLSAREIPVLELPPLPRALPDGRWTWSASRAAPKRAGHPDAGHPDAGRPDADGVG